MFPDFPLNQSIKWRLADEVAEINEWWFISCRKKTYTETMVFVLMQNMIIGLVDYLLVKNCPNKCWKTENCTECRGGLGKFKLENYDVYSQMYIYI